MAILSKIRQRSFFLIVIIALALFSFVLADVIKGGTFGGDAKNAGSVNGTDIPMTDFQAKVGQAEANGAVGLQAVNGVWEQEVRRILLTEEYEKLGMRVGPDQLIAVIKQNPYFANDAQFKNEAGQFDEKKLKTFIKTMMTSPNADQKNQWALFEKEAEKNYKEQLYFSMIKSGMQTTQIEAKHAYQNENDKVNFDYVTLSYTSVNDDQAKVSDDEIIAYMKENKKKYKADKTADLDVVFIENKPSKEDEDAMKKSIEGLLNGKIVYNAETGKNDTLPSFKNATNNAEYVNNNSDIKFDSTYKAKKDLPLEYQEQLFNLPNGEVFGPYSDGGYQKLSKKIGSKSGSSAKASHILIAYVGAERADAAIKRTKEEAKALANSLLAQAKANPANFAMLAITNSDDPGSKQNGGEYDNVMPNQMVKPFNDYIFNNPIGSIGLVETEFGFHVIKVTDKYNSVLLATVAQKTEPSETTSDENYMKASKFEAEANTKDFEKTAKEMGFEVTPVLSLKTTDENIGTIGAQRAVVVWAFSNSTDKGDIKRFDVPNGFVIAKLKAINDTGLLSVETARGQIEPILKNKKKAAIIINKMKGKTLEEVSKATNASVIPAVGVVMLNAAIPNIGPEPKVVGKAFGLKPGTTSGLIEGAYGVYMIKSKSVTKAPELPNYVNYVNQLKSQSQGSASNRAIEALKANAEIKDLRIK